MISLSTAVRIKVTDFGGARAENRVTSTLASARQVRDRGSGTRSDIALVPPGGIAGYSPMLAL